MALPTQIELQIVTPERLIVSEQVDEIQVPGVEGYFGVLPGYQGRGLGKYLLTRAVEEGWRRGANRVWLHTCTLDHPGALPNYLKRGFRAVREESYLADLPD